MLVGFPPLKTAFPKTLFPPKTMPLAVIGSFKLRYPVLPITGIQTLVTTELLVIPVVLVAVSARNYARVDQTDDAQSSSRELLAHGEFFAGVGVFGLIQPVHGAIQANALVFGAYVLATIVAWVSFRRGSPLVSQRLHNQSTNGWFTSRQPSTPTVDGFDE